MTPTVFSSWKEIAQYFGKSVRTVQRWEKTLQLPVIRPEAADSNIVLAQVADLEAWMRRAKLREPLGAGDTVEKAPSRQESRQRVKRMVSLVASLRQNTERLRVNTSAMVVYLDRDRTTVRNAGATTPARRVAASPLLPQ